MRPSYFINKALAGMRNALLVNLLAVVTIAVSLTLLGVFFVVIINATSLTERLGSRLEVVAYLKDNVSGELLTGLEENIKSFPEVREIAYISKEEALASLKKGLADDPSVLDGIEGNPLPASLVIRLKDDFQNSGGIKSVTRKLRGISSVEDLQYGGELLERFSVLISVIKFGGAALGLGLILSTLLIVSNTIKLTIQTRMDEVEVMRLVGATPLFIKTPFFIEGGILGLIGAFFATLTITTLKWLIEYNLGSDLNLLFGAGIDLLPYQAVVGLFAFGMAFGLSGSVISLWRFPKT